MFDSYAIKLRAYFVLRARYIEVADLQEMRNDEVELVCLLPTVAHEEEVHHCGRNELRGMGRHAITFTTRTLLDLQKRRPQRLHHIRK